jgi:hypothetical protein
MEKNNKKLQTDILKFKIKKDTFINYYKYIKKG